MDPMTYLMRQLVDRERYLPVAQNLFEVLQNEDDL